MSAPISDHSVALVLWGNRSRPLCSELSELWDSQSILSLSLCLSLCVSHCSLYTEMEVMCGQELRMDNLEAAIYSELLFLQLTSHPLCWPDSAAILPHSPCFISLL